MLIQIPSDIPVLPGCRFRGTHFEPTDTDGSDLYTVERILRTPRGSVKRYAPDYPGVMIEPPATNYLLNSNTPATQTTGNLATGTYTLWVEGTGSAAVTAGTATIADNGTAEEGTPDTFSVSVAGTVTVTVTDPLTYIQLEGGSFPTSRIPTTTGTVTRPADIITRPTPSWLMARKNDFWICQRCKPIGAGQVGKFLLSFYSSANAAFSLILNASDITLRKRLLGANTDCLVAYTHAADTLFEVIAYQSGVAGMGLAVRVHDGDVWGNWSAWDVDVSTVAIVPGALYNIGATGNATDGFSLQAAAHFPWTQIGRIPSNLQSAEAIQAWLVAEVETPPGGTYLVTADGSYLTV